MPEPRDRNVIGGQDRLDRRPGAGLTGIVYHICGGRFNVDTYTNNKSNRRQQEQGSDPARACVGRQCPGCGRTAERHELASLSDLERDYPGLVIGKAIRRWQKAARRAAPPELPIDSRKYEQRRLF
jgi:hypothetical protein